MIRPSTTYLPRIAGLRQTPGSIRFVRGEARRTSNRSTPLTTGQAPKQFVMWVKCSDSTAVSSCDAHTNECNAKRKAQPPMQRTRGKSFFSFYGRAIETRSILLLPAWRMCAKGSFYSAATSAHDFTSPVGHQQTELCD